MTTERKTGLVHFCECVRCLCAFYQKWTCPLFRGRGVGKGDRSIFRRRLSEGQRLRAKNGPVPFSDGFSLLEIILSLAILAGSLAALGEVMRLADQNSTLTRDESEAQILAASVMDELVAGARDFVALNGAPFDFETELPWVYSIAIEPTSFNELVAVRVLVEQDLDPSLQPARYELIRWLPNPDYVPATSGGTSGSSGTSGG
jgi:prepilin-type N-terminal cleavage/methylation domain-containing protein